MLSLLFKQNIICHYQMSYIIQLIIYIYSYTGIWEKKITSTAATTHTYSINSNNLFMTKFICQNNFITRIVRTVIKEKMK